MVKEKINLESISGGMDEKTKYRVKGYSESAHKQIDHLCTEYKFAVDLCNMYGISLDCISEIRFS